VNRKKVLVTGGAGFVGSHTVDALVRSGHSVRIFDNLSEQVHPAGAPEYLSRDAEFIKGDVRDLAALSRALRGVDVVYHLAAAVGVGQSMYQIAEYTSVNNQGTANLLQSILNTRSYPEKLIIASSMSIYGEGRYLCSKCGEIAPLPRVSEQLKRKEWDTLCPTCGRRAMPLATTEEKPLQCPSVYALSKKDQEEMTLLFGRTYGIPVVAFRYFNIYGTRQSLSNPYTGVAAIFASRLMNGSAPVIFEDGEQMRDFVHISDIVQANLLAMERTEADGRALNVGSGEPVTISQVEAELARALRKTVSPEVTGKYRAGDIRHCFSDSSAVSQLLGYRPHVMLKEGIQELTDWLESQEANDHVEEAMERLNIHGLVA
jgi:dTDP-L-rhamnose 4-epimerase